MMDGRNAANHNGVSLNDGRRYVCNIQRRQHVANNLLVIVSIYSSEHLSFDLSSHSSYLVQSSKV